MNVAYNVSGQAPVDAVDVRSSGPLRVVRLVLLPLSLVLWAIGVSETSTGSLGPYGLPSALPPIFYAGVALLIVSAGIEFSRPSLSSVRLGLHTVALVVILYGTAPLVYREGRYSWLYKTIGVVQYVNAHGSLDRSIDIYQNWPGFFALAAWFDKVTGATSPVDYAKWAQLVFELAAIPLLYTIYDSLALPIWHRWLAIMLYAGSNWIGADYYSPQGMSTLLSLGIMALVMRCLFVVGPGPGRRRHADGQALGDRGASRDATGPQLRDVAPFIALLAFIFFVLTASHELSPYILTIQLAALAVFGLVRPRLVVLGAAVIVLGYLIPNFSFVNNHYGLLSSMGSFLNNVQAPSTGGSVVATPESHKILADCTDLLSVGMWLLAIAGAWLRRKSRRMALALVLLAFTPIIVLVGGAYGNEGVLRVYLFSLPWAAVLATCALAPVRPAADRRGRHASEATPLRAFRAVVPLALALALFFPSFFGNDATDMMSSDEVATVLAFQQSAKAGPMLGASDNAPFSDTARYNAFPTGEIFGTDGAWGTKPATADIATYLARSMEHFFGSGRAGYAMVTPSMAAYNKAYGVVPASSFTTLLASLAKSPYWTLVASKNGTEIYQLSKAAPSIPSGPYAENLVVGVP